MKHLILHLTPFAAQLRWVRHHAGAGAEFLAALAGGAVLTLMVAALLGHGAAVVAALALFGAAGLVAWIGLHRSFEHGELGLCNLITTARLAMTCGLAALLFTPGTIGPGLMWLGFAIAVLTLSLDGVDGWAARRAGLTSAFGARFDMEVDSLLALLLAALAVRTGQAGLWVLALGLPHYLFVVAGAIWPWLRGDLPARFGRKVVCVLQIGVLVAFLVPIMPDALLTAGAVGALAGLGWSFLRDVRHLHARS